MIKVEFNSKVKGVTEVNCNHSDFVFEKGKLFVQLHFTKLIKWIVDPSLIKATTGTQPTLSN